MVVAVAVGETAVTEEVTGNTVLDTGTQIVQTDRERETTPETMTNQ